jgi:hypothetical protein
VIRRNANWQCCSQGQNCEAKTKDRTLEAKTKAKDRTLEAKDRTLEAKTKDRILEAKACPRGLQHCQLDVAAKLHLIIFWRMICSLSRFFLCFPFGENQKCVTYFLEV